MIDQSLVKKLIDEIIAQQGAFLVELSLDQGNKIKVVVDHVKGITLEQLTQVSRAIEQGLNRDEEDFEITVTSPGVGEPLKVEQQYEQNLGRKLKVKTTQGEEFEGRLSNFDNQEITLTWKAREPKEVGKGKVTVNKEKKISLPDIAESRVQIEFK